MNEIIRATEERLRNNSGSNQASNSIPFASTKYIRKSDVIELRNEDGDPIDYDETDLTRGMRERLTRWNDFAEANHWVDLWVPDSTLSRPLQRDPIAAIEEDSFGERAREQPLYVDFRKIRLHRVFNNSLEEGGRFYGGWWQNIPSKYREFIMINGVPTRELDYSNLHAAMLYAREGLRWIGEDAYSLPGIDRRYRPLIKTTFFKLINALEGQPIRGPSREALPPGLSWPDLQNAIKERHAPISRHLHSGIGLKLQQIDSDIAETVMMKMMEQDRLALPVHDSFITYIGSIDTLTEIMKEAYRDKMRAEIGIDLDASFIDAAGAEAHADIWPDARQILEWQEQEPGYADYHERLRTFTENRGPDWHQRFGDPELSSRE